MLKIKLFHFNPLEACCAVLSLESSSSCLICDPGMYDESEREALLSLLEKEGLTPEAILLTHGHFDHIFGAAFLQKKYGIPVFMHPSDKKTVRLSPAFAAYFSSRVLDASFVTTDISDGEILSLSGLEIKVIATPGHTPGGVCYYIGSEGVLLSGDTLFAGSIGRSDLPGGDYDLLIRSVLDRLMVLPPETDVIPGHGPATTIGHESGTNPFLLPFNEPDDSPWWNSPAE